MTPTKDARVARTFSTDAIGIPPQVPAQDQPLRPDHHVDHHRDACMAPPERTPVAPAQAPQDAEHAQDTAAAWDALLEPLFRHARPPLPGNEAHPDDAEGSST